MKRELIVAEDAARGHRHAANNGSRMLQTTSLSFLVAAHPDPC